MRDNLKNNLVFKLKVEPIGFDCSRPVGINNPEYGKKFTVSDRFEISCILSNLDVLSSRSIDIEAHAKQDLKHEIFEKLLAPIVYPILSDLRYLLAQPEIRHSDIYDLSKKIDALKYEYILFDESKDAN